VRLDPVEVKKLLPPGQGVPKATTPVQAPVAQPETSISQDDDSKIKRQPVSAAALEAWFKAYQLAYPASSEDTEGKALESARGCFPGKSVSRDAVRKVRGAQRRGRKPTPAK
jgi:hypothetical protein